MERIIIVSKTHMTNAACVGGITTNGKYVRLLNVGGNNQPKNTDFEVGQFWDIEYVERTNLLPPHIEDIIITSKKLVGTLKKERTMLQTVQLYGATIWKGSPDKLFDNSLRWTDNGSGYISDKSDIPNNSVGFWIPDRNLTKRVYYDKVRYSYPIPIGWRSLPYVGFDSAVEVIPAGTLLRVSLARCWDTDGSTEYRCSLQLSGWYNL